MKVKDEAEWQNLLAEFSVDPDPMAPVLKNFLIAWANAAERLTEDDEETHWPPIVALRKTLNLIEAQQQRVPTAVIAAALAILTMHWIYSDQMVEGMNQIELHMVQDITAIKVVQLQEQAQEAGN
jgi:hypothetical protein